MSASVTNPLGARPRQSLGVRAHDFGKWPVEELARRIAAEGLTAIQFAPFKAIAGLEDVPGALTPQKAEEIRTVFAHHGIRISVLGCYVNLGHPDPVERARLIERFKWHLSLAPYFGCEIVGTETGSLNPDWSPHPGNRDPQVMAQTLDVVLDLVEEAGKHGVQVGIEGVTSHIFWGLDAMEALVERAFPGPLRVIFDTYNLMTAETASEHRRIIAEGFRRFGRAIAVLHLKDYTLEGGRLRTVPVGTGAMDTAYLLKEAAALPLPLDLLLEESTPATVRESVAFLKPLMHF